VFEAVQDLIDAAIEEHEVRDHGGGAAMDAGAEDDDDIAAMSAAEGDGIMEPNTKLVEAEAKVINLTEKVTASDVKIVALTARAETAEQSANSLQLDVKAKDAEIVELKAANTALVKERDDRVAKERELRVDLAFNTYKTKKGLVEADKKSLMIELSGDPKRFEERYPLVEADKVHLLANLTGGGDGKPVRPAPSTDNGGDAPVISLRELSRKIAFERKIPLPQAQRIADETLRKARAAKGR
jgi:hypothetical protein